MAEDPAAMVIAHCREAMRRGSLSFFLAARLSGKRLRDAILLLYAWCRYCDDAVDEQDLRLGTAQRLLVLDELRRRTQGAMSQVGETAAAEAGEGEGQMVFAAFALLTRRYHIPDYYPQELLAGMEMDIVGFVYRDVQDLKLYCYRVAATVGLMFSHLAGISDARALKHAADLGTAMQLTNIARDVLTDAALGRVYLPADWLAAEGVTGLGEVAAAASREAVARVVARLLAEADAHYRSGEQGLLYLPLSAAFAAASARYIYADIGHKVRSLGPKAWDQRVVIPLGRKLWLVGLGTMAVLRTLPERWRTPWRSVPIQTLWRFQP